MTQAVALLLLFWMQAPAGDQYKSTLAAAERGEAEAQFNLAVMYRTGDGVAEDPVKAAAWYAKSAEQGYVRAQFNLGVLYLNGIGVGQDFAKAGDWFSKAADKGDAASQFNLGTMYARGDGVSKDPVTALELLMKSAEQELPAAQYMLGVMYCNGDGVPRDLVKAYMWADLAIKAGESEAFNLRRFVEKQMTSAQIKDAQRLSGEWKPGAR